MAKVTKSLQFDHNLDRGLMRDLELFLTLKKEHAEWM